MVANLLGDVLVNKSVAVWQFRTGSELLEQFDCPEHIFHRRLKKTIPRKYLLET